MAETSKAENVTASRTTTTPQKVDANVPNGRPIDVHLPPLNQIDERVLGNSVRQLAYSGGVIHGHSEPFSKRAVKGTVLVPNSDQDLSSPILIIPKRTDASDLPNHVLVAPQGLPTSKGATGTCVWIQFCSAHRLRRTGWLRVGMGCGTVSGME
jgi:hypothetical protein